MSEQAAPSPPKAGAMQRILGAIERGGNKMPNPAILFVWLCVIVIVISALLAWADIKVTYQVVKAPPVPVEEVVQGGSTQPSGGLPDASVQEGEYTVDRGDRLDPEPPVRGRDPLPLHLVRRQLP